jgi:endothelin-converting enzyme/putative endopeptidase
MARLCVGLLLAVAAFGQTPERPLTELPYTPALETKFMDRTADPCVDFFQFACGSWNKLNPIPRDEASWSVYGKLHDENVRYLWGLLEQAAQTGTSRTPNEQRIGDYFASCMDEAAVNRLGAAPLKPLLDAIAAMKKTSDLPSVVARLHMDTSSDALFGFGSGQDYENSDHVIAFASAGGLGLPDRDYYTKTDVKSRETRARYIEHVAAIFRLLGDAPAVARGEAQTVMAIETALAKASLTRVDKRDPYKLLHKMTTAQLNAATPSFRWADYWKADGLAAPAVLNVTEPAFFQEVERQLKTRPLADWKTYLRWNAAHAAAPYLSDAFVNANFAFYGKHLNGVEQMRPRWKRCVNYVDMQLGEALGQVFVAHTFTPETKAATLAMTKQIEAAMETDIQSLPWMGEATRQQAMVKLHGIVNKIGYPDRWRDYSSVRIDRGDFVGNVERATAFESRRQLDKIGKPVDRGEWDITPPTVDAYYDPQKNDINFPAGVLQPPLFDPKMDDAPNYGNTGATIGHELTHGFDDEGRQFDAKGNLRDWWTKQDADQFVQRASCVEQQYSQYTAVDDLKVNGKLTLGENVADLGGTMLAYMAWKAATRNKDLQPIDGFTPDQRFFIGMAQWTCTYERPAYLRLHVQTDEHSPGKYRVNGVVSNMPEFRQAFSCKVGQPMARENSCRVW